MSWPHVAVDAWTIYRDGEAVATIDGSAVGWTDHEAEETSSHYYSVVGRTANGNEHIYGIGVELREDATAQVSSDRMAADITRVDQAILQYETFIPDRYVSDPETLACTERAGGRYVYTGDGTTAGSRPYQNGIRRFDAYLGQQPRDLDPSFRTFAMAEHIYRSPVAFVPAPQHNVTKDVGLTRLVEVAPDGEETTFLEAREPLDGIALTKSATSTTQSTTRVQHSMSDPLCHLDQPSGDIDAPAIDYDVVMTTSTSGSVRITGEHDGAPAHEILYSALQFADTPETINVIGSVDTCLYRSRNQGFSYLFPTFPNVTIDIDVNPSRVSVACDISNPEQ